VESTGSNGDRSTDNRDRESGGYVRKTYALQDLLGDPTIPVERSPLAILARTGRAEVFDTAVIRICIALKWKSFGKTSYMKQKFPYLLVSIFFMAGFISDNLYGRYCTYAVTAYLLFFEELRELLREGVLEYFMSPWNCECAHACGAGRMWSRAHVKQGTWAEHVHSRAHEQRRPQGGFGGSPPDSPR
jgi:hypothetical protein